MAKRNNKKEKPVSTAEKNNSKPPIPVNDERIIELAKPRAARRPGAGQLRRLGRAWEVDVNAKKYLGKDGDDQLWTDVCAAAGVKKGDFIPFPKRRDGKSAATTRRDRKVDGNGFFRYDDGYRPDRKVVETLETAKFFLDLSAKQAEGDDDLTHAEHQTLQAVCEVIDLRKVWLEGGDAGRALIGLIREIGKASGIDFGKRVIVSRSWLKNRGGLGMAFDKFQSTLSRREKKEVESWAKKRMNEGNTQVHSTEKPRHGNAHGNLAAALKKAGVKRGGKSAKNSKKGEGGKRDSKKSPAKSKGGRGGSKTALRKLTA